MDRTIGKIRIKKLKAMVEKEMRFNRDYIQDEDIIRHIPSEWYRRWEGASSEINRIIHDTINEIRYP